MNFYIVAMSVKSYISERFHREQQTHCTDVLSKALFSRGWLFERRLAKTVDEPKFKNTVIHLMNCNVWEVTVIVNEWERGFARD